MTPAAGETAGSRAVVARVDFGACMLLLEDGALLRATARGRLMGPRKALGNAVVVGDMAVYEPTEGRAEAEVSAVVMAIEPRRNAFSRRAPGKHATEQVVAANLDQVVVVSSFAEPPFSAGLTDRVLCQAAHAGLPARLVLNKCDLAPGGLDSPEVRDILHDYDRASVAGHALCARTGQGLAELHETCRGRRSLFVGHSGVGKSTLLSAMVPGLELLAGRVNPKTGKGRHTTSAAWLLRPAPDVELVDTPGVRAFGLWGVDPADLGRLYSEIAPYVHRCRFRDCEHEGEPGCAVRQAVAEGKISQRRYDSMRKLREELRADLGVDDARMGERG
jgi:ribosome biogenesis GTPase / thiamine phosphate phosphatase